MCLLPGVGGDQGSLPPFVPKAMNSRGWTYRFQKKSVEGSRQKDLPLRVLHMFIWGCAASWTGQDMGSNF